MRNSLRIHWGLYVIWRFSSSLQIYIKSYYIINRSNSYQESTGLEEVHRANIEKKCSMPIEKWQKTRKVEVTAVA